MPNTLLLDRDHQRRRTLNIIGPVVAGLVTLGFMVTCVGVLWQNGQHDHTQERLAAENVVTTVGAHISRQVDTHDLALRAVIEALDLPDASLLDPASRKSILFDRAATAKNVGSIVVLNHAGELYSDSEGHHLRGHRHPDHHNLRRHAFTPHLQDPSVGRQISAPWTDSSGEQVISISRKLTDRQGTFRGLVVGILRLDTFQEFFKGISVRKGDVLALVHDDGQLLLRKPFDRGSVATGSSPKILAAASGSFEGVSAMDGVVRLHVFRQVEGTPFVVSNELSLENVYAEWRREAWIIGGLMVALCLVNILLLFALARALKRSEQGERLIALQAATDPLTGLNNRGHFDRVIEMEWNRARRLEQPVALLMIDADHFKDYNDTNGHQAGDVALKTIADGIAAAVRRAGDCAARYGGEEFCVLLPGETTEGATKVAETIRANIAAMRARQTDSLSTPTVSIGAASLVPDADMNADDLVSAADAAMYQAKRGGRDRVVAAPSPPAASSRKKLAA